MQAWGLKTGVGGWASRQGGLREWESGRSWGVADPVVTSVSDKKRLPVVAPERWLWVMRLSPPLPPPTCGGRPCPSSSAGSHWAGCSRPCKHLDGVIHHASGGQLLSGSRSYQPHQELTSGRQPGSPRPPQGAAYSVYTASPHCQQEGG